MKQARLLAVQLPAETPVDTVALSFLYRLVDADTASRCRAFRNPHDALRTLAGRALALLLVSQLTHIAPSRIRLTASAGGKPILGEPSPQGYHFNIAHSGNWAVAVLDTEPVGIDIEQIVDIELESVAAVLSPEERQTLVMANRQHGKRSATDRLFCIWTAKESFLKYLGVGISNTGKWQPRNLSIRLDENNVSLERSHSPATPHHLLWLQNFEGYSCCVCLNAGRSLDTPALISFHDLLRQLKALG